MTTVMAFAGVRRLFSFASTSEDGPACSEAEEGNEENDGQQDADHDADDGSGAQASATGGRCRAVHDTAGGANRGLEGHRRRDGAVDRGGRRHYAAGWSEWRVKRWRCRRNGVIAAEVGRAEATGHSRHALTGMGALLVLGTADATAGDTAAGLSRRAGDVCLDGRLSAAKKRAVSRYSSDQVRLSPGGGVVFPVTVAIATGPFSGDAATTGNA